MRTGPARAHRRRGVIIIAGAAVLAGCMRSCAAVVAAAGGPLAASAQDSEVADASQVVPYFSQHITFLEAENMTTGAGDWEPRQWAHGGNYFASTVNNVFMSRRMYLHAPANATVDGGTVARGNITIADSGEYMVMARYEALYRFETGFNITIRQHGWTVFSKVYGRRSNYKTWGQKGQGTDTFDDSGQNCAGITNRECVWQWGSVENMVSVL